ncbi:MAG: DUF1844 domain-containing protein [Acidobacteria bacterium]|jgi:hypothetical protein|nr:DUF1844 domain-containing protein [Acidobacteriota bacterium]
MSESKKSFTVKDRRHFTPEGQVREEPEKPVDAGESSGEASSTAAAAGADHELSPPATDPEDDRPVGSAPAEAPPGSSSTTPDPGGGEAAGAGPADFGQFLLSLGAQAGMLLSGQGLPEGTDAGEALAGARSIISILEMLKGKTEGRRTDQEDEVLEGLLYQLRMAYVERSRAGGS